MSMANPLRLPAAVVAVALGVWLTGQAIVGPQGDAGVLIGAALGGSLQLGYVATLGCRTAGASFEGRLALMTAAMFARALVIVITGVILVPALALPVGPTLLALAAVFVLTGILEPFSTLQLRTGA